MTIFYDDNNVQKQEKELIRQRREKVPTLDPKAPTVGFALSGGGIRSATFCLGIFQALAKLTDSSSGISKIHKIDYLSTVSGGGYFGAFLGRLFTRRADVETVLENNQSDEIKWLRENGRYLSPDGGGDLLRVIALTLRNWISTQIVMASLALFSFFLLHWLEFKGFPDIVAYFNLTGIPALTFELPDNARQLWLSSWWILPVTAIAIFTVPPGWAYWMVIHDKLSWNSLKTGIKDQSILWISPLVGLGLATGLTGVVAYAANNLIWWGLFCLSVLTWSFWLLAESIAQSETRKLAGAVNIYVDDRARHWLTGAMKFGLTLSLALMLLALIDTLAKSLLLVFAYHNYGFYNSVSALWIGSFALSGLIAPFVDRIVSWLGALQKGKTLELPLKWLGQFAGIAVFGVILVSIDALSYAIFWDFPRPTQATTSINPYSSLILLFLFVFSWLFGRNWSFLNRSSLHALYSSRLARAYLGATNPSRHQKNTAKNSAVVDVLPDDDITLDDYYKQSLSNSAPLHLINVTVNQTVDSASQIQQQDRKGYYLSIGPAGFCLGGAIANNGEAPTPIPLPGQLNQNSHQDFKSSPCEDLSLGQTVAISGAAFSTGMGEQTGIGLSLLIGFFNLRLGYWWNAHGWKKDGKRNDALTAVTERLAWLFPVQSYILDEYLARFHGPTKELWNLSDGGHFENMGAYELIRRKIPRIVIIDAEADPEFQFQGLGNLVRKVRIDFDAEVEFYSLTQLDTLANNAKTVHPNWLGALGDIKDGKAYAALAKVNYPSAPPSMLLYIKAAVIGNEPRDILHYRDTNPSFPQQSTADQFFDEAQWESYRKLGEHIGNQVFQEPAVSSDFI
jgi:hypothetical protein